MANKYEHAVAAKSSLILGLISLIVMIVGLIGISFLGIFSVIIALPISVLIGIFGIIRGLQGTSIKEISVKPQDPQDLSVRLRNFKFSLAGIILSILFSVIFIYIFFFLIRLIEGAQVKLLPLATL